MHHIQSASLRNGNRCYETPCITNELYYSIIEISSSSVFRSVYESKKYTDVAQIKDVWKWRCGPLLTDLLGAAFDVKSKFEVTLTFQYENSNRECSFL